MIFAAYRYMTRYMLQSTSLKLTTTWRSRLAALLELLSIFWWHQLHRFSDRQCPTLSEGLPWAIFPQPFQTSCSTVQYRIHQYLVYSNNNKVWQKITEWYKILRNIYVKWAKEFICPHNSMTMYTLSVITSIWTTSFVQNVAISN